MTVAELIDELAKREPSAVVAFPNFDFGDVTRGRSAYVQVNRVIAEPLNNLVLLFPSPGHELVEVAS